jgi:hypothetical protein
MGLLLFPLAGKVSRHLLRCTQIPNYARALPRAAMTSVGRTFPTRRACQPDGVVQAARLLGRPDKHGKCRTTMLASRAYSWYFVDLME